jgi:anti-sigma factor RsiW
MIDRADHTSDEELVAYLDGELSPADQGALETQLGADPALKARLDQLAAGNRPFVESFEVLLRAAPSERLQNILAGVVADWPARNAGTGLHRNYRLAAIAAAILLFVGGAVVGTSLPGILPLGESENVGAPEGWRAVVADYLTLYTRDTLADIPDNTALREKELASVGGKLALELSTDKVQLPDLILKRSQIFALDGKPLAQILYLSPENGPVALCIMNDGDKPGEGLKFENRQGRNIVYWSKAGHKFMLIGNLPKSQLETLAASLAVRVV